MRYLAIAIERDKAVCTVGLPSGLDVSTAAEWAHDLRLEFPDAVVAVLPAGLSRPDRWPWH